MLAMRDGVAPPAINVDETDCDLDRGSEAGRKLRTEHAVANWMVFGSKNSVMGLRRVQGGNKNRRAIGGKRPPGGPRES